MHTYHVIENNPIFKGMPKFTEEFNQYCEDFPLYCTLLLTISSIPMGDIIIGKKVDNKELVEQRFRQYEFQLHGDISEGWGIMHLFIKNKNSFFKDQPSFNYLHNKEWQKIPLTYETMSRMTDKELSIIWLDFD